MSLLLMAMAQGIVGLDPSVPVGQYRSHTWKQTDGLPQNSALAITQDAEGYLWIATFGGLARFNGRRFTIFSSESHEGFPSDRITALFPEPDGTLWIGTEHAGVTSLRHGRFRRCPNFEGLEDAHVVSIVPGQASQIFLGTSKGLYELHEGAPVRHWTTRDGLLTDAVWALLPEPDGGLWVGTTGGLSYLSRGSVQRLPDQTLSGVAIRALVRGREGSIWIGTSEGLFRMTGHLTTRVSLGENDRATIILSLLEDKDGSLWLGLRGGGICRLHEGAMERYTSSGGLPNDLVSALFEDREGTIWIGTDGGGIQQLTETLVIAYGSPKGPLGVTVRCVEADGAGGYWIGTGGVPFKGLAHLTSKGIEFLADRKLASMSGIRSLFNDGHGTLWIGCPGVGLYLLKNGVFSPGPRLPVPSGDVLSIARGEHGSLLLGTTGGLLEIDNRVGPVHLVPGTEGLVIQCILPAGGVRWLGTTKGLYALSPAGIKRWDRSSGLSHGNVRALYLDARGFLWIGTYGDGLGRLAKDRFFHFGPACGFPTDTISFIAEDPNGQLWMTSNQGVFSMARRQLDALADGTGTSLDVVQITEDDGMVSRECNGGSLPAGILTPQGELVVPTINGIAVIHTRKTYPIPLPPPVRIESVLVDDKEVPASGELVLPPSSRTIEIQYSALSFAHLGRIRYRVRLDRADASWMDMQNRGEILYNHLPPGSYRFRVIADNGSGVWNKKGASLSFRIRPRFYQTWWFYALAALAIFFAGLGTYAFQAHRLKVNAVKLARLVDERTQSLQDEKDRAEKLGASLQAAMSELEVRVEERTAELSQANLMLQDELRARESVELALMDREGELKAVIYGTPIPQFIIDQNHTVIHWNRALEELTGIKAERVVGTKRHSEAFYTQERPCLADLLADARTDLLPKWYRETWRFSRFVTGAYEATDFLPMLGKWIHFTASTIRDIHGKAIGAVETIEDITERKQMEIQIAQMSLLKLGLLSTGDLDGGLKLITDATVEILGADFARIWMVEEGDLCDRGCIHSQIKEGPHACRDRARCLHLKASSGRYTHTDGDHRRVPLGSYKIGRIAASEEAKFLTNDVQHDPRVHDRAWAKSLGLEAFAGYRLQTDSGQPVGVLALFRQRAILPHEGELIADLAHTASQLLQADRARDALRRSEETFSTAFNASPATLWIARLAGRKVIEINKAFEELTGYSRQEAIGKTTVELGLWIDPKEQDQMVKILNEEGTVRNREFRYRTKSGQVITCQYGAEQLPIAGEECVLVHLVDITARKRAEKAIEERERWLVQAQSLARLGWYTLDQRTGVFTTSKVVDEIFGSTSRDPHDVKTWLAAIHPDDRPIVEAKFGDAVLKKEPLSMEYRILRLHDGAERWVLIHMESESKRAEEAHRFFGVIQDITERKRAEDEIRRLATIVEQIAQAVVVTDTDGTIEYVNEAFSAITHYSRQDAIGRNPRLLKSGAHDAAFYEEMWRTIKAGETWKGALVNRRKDGALYNGEATITPVRDPAGKIRHFVKVERDVTQQLAQSRRTQEQEKLAAIGSIAAGIAHEVKNPLFAISSGIQLLMDELALNEEQTRTFEIIYEDVMRMDRLVRQLMIFSSRRELRKVSIPLLALVREAITVNRGLLQGKSLRITESLGPRLPDLSVDRDQIHQVLLNLFQNAISVSPEDSQIEVSAELARDRASVAIRVRDHGPGIPDELRERVFEPFFSTKRGSAGMGLAISRRIALDHGGNLAAENHPEGGAVFILELPAETPR